MKQHQAHTIQELASRREPWVIAHRGCSGRFPENTLEAFRAAVEEGADLIELDVSLSLDRVPVVIHDDTLDRTTSGSGKVSDHSLAELRQLDAGSWFASEFSEARIPTLEEVFVECGGQIVINVELKPEGFEEQDVPDAVERQVLQLVERYTLQKSVILSSFEHRFFPRIRQNHSLLPIALLFENLPEAQAVIAQCEEWQAQAVNPRADTLHPEWISTLRAAGLDVLPWTVDDPEAMRTLLGWGVRGLFTNFPERLQPLVSHAAA